MIPPRPALPRPPGKPCVSHGRFWWILPDSPDPPNRKRVPGRWGLWPTGFPVSTLLFIQMPRFLSGGGGGLITVVIYGEVNEARPSLSPSLWEDTGKPGLLRGDGWRPHPTSSFSQLRLQLVPTAPAPLQTLWLVTAKRKLKYWRTSTHHYSPGKLPEVSSFQMGVASLRVESGGFQPNPTAHRLAQGV